MGIKASEINNTHKRRCNFLDAIKSGKPFRRVHPQSEMDELWLIADSESNDIINIEDGSPMVFELDDYLDSYELMYKTVTISEDGFDRLLEQHMGNYESAEEFWKHSKKDLGF